MDLTKLKEKLNRAFKDILESFEPIPAPETPETERAISIGMIWEQARNLLWETYPDEWYYISDIIEDNGALYGIISNEGRLWRVAITVSGSEVSIGAIEQVEVNYTPVSFRSRGIKIIRQKDGSRLWMRVVSAAVLLRGAKLEIDSTALMDSFLEHIERTGEYPIASFWHTGEAMRVGQSIALWRDEKMLCDIGKFDDTPFAQRMADSLEADPDYWGTSIEYYDDIEAAQIEIMGGAPVIVHRKGVLTSCDFLPQDVAASLFTGGVRTIQRGKMLTQAQRDALKSKVKLDDTEIDDFEGLVRERNNEAAGMISRQAEKETPEGELEGTLEFELTDELVDQIAEAVAPRLSQDAALATVQAEVTELRSALAEAITELQQVREIATANDEARRRAIASTMPKSGTITLTARNKVAVTPEADDDDEDDEPEVVSAHKRTVAAPSAAAQRFAASKRK